MIRNERWLSACKVSFVGASVVEWALATFTFNLTCIESAAQWNVEMI